MLILFLVTALLMHCTHSKQQADKTTLEATEQIVGGGCDGCELMYVGLPKNLNATDTSSAWETGSRKLVITGTVFQNDGQTPAPNVTLYYWQTDKNGLYSAAAGTNEKTTRHGHIRGWMKTGADGKYALYTIRPAAYPDSRNPEHIHIAVKEPALNEYYIDELVFDNDKFLTPEIRQRHENRGGSGILKTAKTNGTETAMHDIVLGLNIPGYPKK